VKNVIVPYTGITDFATAEQVEETLKLFKKLHPDPSVRRCMIGVMMSYKTLNGLESKWAGIWPQDEALEALFTGDASAYNTLHWADYEDKTTLFDLQGACSQCGNHLHALQFDMILPDLDLLSEIKVVEGVDIILQVNKETFRRAGYNDESYMDIEDMITSTGAVGIRRVDFLIDILHQYKDTVDVFLLDLSAGRGKQMNPYLMETFVMALQSEGMQCAVAGGLGPGDKLDVLQSIVSQCGHVSWDAQGNLRPSGNAMDPIDQEYINEYLVDSKTMIAMHG